MTNSWVLVLAAFFALLTSGHSQTTPSTPGEYVITFRSSSSPHQVSTPADQKKNWFVEVGQKFGGGNRFLATKMEKKRVPDPVTGEKDVSELTIVDQTTGKTHVLVLGKQLSIPSAAAK